MEIIESMDWYGWLNEFERETKYFKIRPNATAKYIKHIIEKNAQSPWDFEAVFISNDRSHFTVLHRCRERMEATIRIKEHAWRDGSGAQHGYDPPYGEIVITEEHDLKMIKNELQ